MNNINIDRAQELINNINNDNNVKVLKKDRSIIERTESSKVILTEDNRQLLVD